MAEWPDSRLTRKFLETSLEGLPGHAIEVRSRQDANPLYSKPQYRKYEGEIWKVTRASNGVAITGLFTDPELLLRELRKVERVSMYAVVNPVPLGRKQLLYPLDRFRKAWAGSCTCDDDIGRICWGYIDVDRRDHGHGNATLDEISKCWNVARKIAEYMGMSPNNVGMSGNGAFVLPRLDLPNTPASRRLFRRSLEHLAAEFSDEHVSIDTTTSNPARLFPLPGTVKYKDVCGETRGRRCRKVTLRGWDGEAGGKGVAPGLMEGVLTLGREPVDLRSLLLNAGIDPDEPVVEERPRKSRLVSPATTAPSGTAAAADAAAAAVTIATEETPAPDTDAIGRAREWLAERPGAIERSRQTQAQREEMRGGAAYTCSTIGHLVREFGIHDRAILTTLLEAWNLKCDPPWLPGDLLAKVEYVLANPRAGRRRRGRRPRAGTMRPPRIDFGGIEGVG